jgi:hypothetical protein
MTEMSAITIHFRVSPEILRAAQTLACRRIGWIWVCHLLARFLLWAGVMVVLLFFLHTISRYNAYTILFVVACFMGHFLCFHLCTAALRRRLAKEWEEISLSVTEEGLFFTQAQQVQTLYFWPYVEEIREIRARRGGDDWLAVLMDSCTAGYDVLPVPRTAFADDAGQRAFVDAVNAGIKKASAHGAPVDSTRT